MSVKKFKIIFQNVHLFYYFRKNFDIYRMPLFEECEIESKRVKLFVNALFHSQYDETLREKMSGEDK
jgi:hypothetical protein